MKTTETGQAGIIRKYLKGDELVTDLALHLLQCFLLDFIDMKIKWNTADI